VGFQSYQGAGEGGEEVEEDEEGAESTGRTASSSIEGQVPVSVLFVVLQHNSTLEDYLQREKKKYGYWYLSFY
jgi:hypothetical protein